jgi:parvulin-like peptidyl-prolyl isomerase
MNRPLILAAALALSPVAAARAAGAPAAAPKAEAPKAAAPAPKPDATAAAAKETAPEATFAYLKAPLFAEEFASFPVARVEDRVITLQEVTDALASAHGTHAKETKAGSVDVTPIIDRLVDIHLLAMEARNMGIDDLPEFKESMVDFKQRTGREMLKDRVTAGSKPDAAEVDRFYRDAIRTWKARSVLFANESDAIKLKAESDAGKKFEDLAKEAVAAGKGKGGEEAQVLPRAKLLPNVHAALEKMKPGEVSAPLRLEQGWAVIQVAEILYPDDAKMRAEIERTKDGEAKQKALEKAYGGLVKRYAKVDRKLLASLDYDAKRPGIPALKKDKRVLAALQGAKPITVGELTGALVGGFYHGVERAIESKKANRQKADVFDGLLSRRIVPLEVKRLGIDESPEFKRRVVAYEDSLLFASFLKQVIAPKVTVTEESVRKYFDAHRKDYTYPAFYKLESLAFATAKEAQAAVDKLRSGTDFKWLNANSESQIPAAERKAKLDGTIAATSLPKDLAEALAGAKVGDHRLYADPAQQFYAVHVVEIVPPQEQPYEEVRSKIEDVLFYDQINADLKDFAGKLRKASDVKVFITKIGS